MTKDDVYIDELVWIKSKVMPISVKARALRELTVQPRGYKGEKLEKICTMIFDEGWIGLPIHYGLKTFQKIVVAHDIKEAMSRIPDHRNLGDDVTFNSNIKPRDPQQAKFFSDTLRAIRDTHTVLAKAPTGSGKTCASLDVISKIGRRTLVVCPTERIALQWIKSASNPELLNLPEEEVGSVMGGKWNWEGKQVVVAIIHNLTDASKLPDGFSEYFGFVVWDEAHNLGARTFSQTMLSVCAKYRLALSATPKRKDGCESLFTNYFGAPAVQHTGNALRARVHVYDFVWNEKFVEKHFKKAPDFVFKRIIQATRGRNNFIADCATRWYYGGRHILVLAEQVKHLQELMTLVNERGVPLEALGLFVGSYKTEEGKVVKIKNTELDRVAESCRVIFATYGKGKEGLDIPRLDAGIDAYPRSEGEQAIGRIRRPLEEKKLPLWITIRDKGIPKMVRMTQKRLSDYRGCNVEVIENGEAKVV